MYVERIKEIIEKENITITSLCKNLDLDRSTLGKYISGYHIIPLKYLNSLCNYFNISIDYVFGILDIKNYSNYKEDIDLKLFSERLKEFRKHNKINQEKLAIFLKCQHSTISEYEHSKRLITTSALYELCKKHKISADYLLGKIDDPKYLK